jgi:aryl-alcohol dehydrogenase-like predicted oxidoreductase
MRLGLEDRPDADEAIRTIHAALDAGLRVIDTAINYCTGPDEFGYNERIVARALREWSGDRDSVLVIGKGGNLRSETEQFFHDGSPENLRWSCETSLRALEVDAIGLYMLHSIDPKVPLEESMGALKDLRDEGKIQLVGISNAGRRQLEQARQVVEIAAVENQLSLWSRGSLPVAEVCTNDGITMFAWGPLGSRGHSGDLSQPSPALKRIAQARGASTAQVALAWAMGQSPCVIPIPGARRPATILDSAAALQLRLTHDEIEQLA